MEQDRKKLGDNDNLLKSERLDLLEDAGITNYINHYPVDSTSNPNFVLGQANISWLTYPMAI